MATPIPKNEARFSLSDILTATGGRLRGPLADEALEVRGVSTDTRTLRPGEMFVAIRGEHFDGHDHLASASKAALALVERDVAAPPGVSIVRVADTLEALGALAKHHLDRWRRLGDVRRVFALTGSAGKTTTRHAIAALLCEATDPKEVHASSGNLNNLVGAPMTVLALAHQHHYAVLELGTNRSGEIGRLARMVRPDVGLITLIASAHAEGLGDIDAIAREKSALYSEVREVAIGNYGDARVRAALVRSDRPRIGYGEDARCDYYFWGRKVIDERRAKLTIVRADRSTIDVEIGLVGRAGALACVAAVASVEALLRVPVNAAAVTRAMRDLEGRLSPRRAPSGLVVLDDSYNANPASCASSIEAAREIADALNRRLLLVLGEMRELGATSAEAHDALGNLAAESGAGWLLAVGGDARLTAERAASLGMDARFAESAAEAASIACQRVEAGDVVLVKGSRGVRTEAIVEALLQPVNVQAGVAP